MSLFKNFSKVNMEPENKDQDIPDVSETQETDTDETAAENEPIKSELEDQLFYQTIDYCSSPATNHLSNIQRGKLSKENFFEKVEEYLRKSTDDETIIENIKERLKTYIWGYYIVDKYLYDDEISDIKILDESHIRLKKNGKRIDADAKFKNVADYERFVDIICARNKVNLTDRNAILKFTDTESNPKCRIRFNITSKLINSTRKPYVQMRKILKTKKGWDQLLGVMIPPELRPYLIDAFQNSPGILFTGKGASGKTTLMNLGLEEIPEDESGLVVQENDELFSKHPDMMFQHIVDSRNESKIHYDLKDLATNGLLTDLDYFIIGEIKGDEAASFMNAAYTGHKCWASVHGVNSQEAINKLVDYVHQSTTYSRKDINRMLRFMKTIIFMKDYHIEEISEVTGIDRDGELTYKMIYKRGEIDYVA